MLDFVTRPTKPLNFQRFRVVVMVGFDVGVTADFASPLRDPPTFHGLRNCDTSFLLCPKVGVVLIPSPHVFGVELPTSLRILSWHLRSSVETRLSTCPPPMLPLLSRLVTLPACNRGCLGLASACANFDLCLASVGRLSSCRPDPPRWPDGVESFRRVHRPGVTPGHSPTSAAVQPRHLPPTGLAV